jgi:hypothetical protein
VCTISTILNEQPHLALIIEYKTRQWNIAVVIQVLTWDCYKNVAGINWLRVVFGYIFTEILTFKLFSFPIF